jgi:hypothetical protein
MRSKGEEEDMQVLWWVFDIDLLFEFCFHWVLEMREELVDVIMRR